MMTMTAEDTEIFITGPMSRLRMRRDDATDYSLMRHQTGAREAYGENIAARVRNWPSAPEARIVRGGI